MNRHEPDLAAICSTVRLVPNSADLAYPGRSSQIVMFCLVNSTRFQRAKRNDGKQRRLNCARTALAETLNPLDDVWEGFT